MRKNKKTISNKLNIEDKSNKIKKFIKVVNTKKIRKVKIEEKVLEQLNNLNHTLNKNKILDLIELTGDTKKFLFRNFTSGIVKGMGVGIGVTIITAIIIYILQKIIKLNIPIISKYISDIVEIVQNSK